MAGTGQVNRSGANFGLVVGRRVAALKDRNKKVFVESVISMVELMQRPVSQGGNMPVQTQFLRASLQASTSPIAMATIERPSKKGWWNYYPNRVEDAIRAMKMGDKMHLGYLAKHVWLAEFGGKTIQAHGFQRLAIQAFPSIVSQTVARIRGQAMNS